MLLLVLSGGARLAAPLSDYDFYRNPFGGDNILPEGDSAYEMIKLDGPPIQFYSQQYDHIYVSQFVVGGGDGWWCCLRKG